MFFFTIVCEEYKFISNKEHLSFYQTESDTAVKFIKDILLRACYHYCRQHFDDASKMLDKKSN